MNADQTNQFHLFPGTQEQWDDSLKRSAAYTRYIERRCGSACTHLAFLDLPYQQRPLALAEYALSIGISQC